MEDAFDFAAYAERVRRMVAAGLAEECSPVGLAKIAGRVAAQAEETLARGQDDGEGAHIACRAGCGSCCMVNVAVLFPEAIAIAGYLRDHLRPAQLAALRKSLDDLYRDCRWLDDEERIALRRSCALLDGQAACAVHPVRPLLCRSVTSTDAEACREALFLMPLGESRPVLMNLFQRELMDASYAAAAAGLEATGLDARGVPLTTALKRLFDDPSLAERFAAGERLAL